MTKIKQIVPLFLVALFTAGGMVAGQAAAGNLSKIDCDNESASTISQEMEARDN